MGIVIRLAHRHARTSAAAGHKSGRSSLRETPVSFSIDKTNSAGTPRFDFSSQYQTCDCVVPMRSAKGFCPPASSQARLSASLDMGTKYPNLGISQPKNLSKTANLNFGSFEPMKEANPIAFGNRVRERRKARGLTQDRLAELSGYSQTNIYWIEKGEMQRPHIQAQALAEALQTTAEYLLHGTGPKEIGPPIMDDDELLKNFHMMSPEDRATISASISECVGAFKEKRKVKPDPEKSKQASPIRHR
jgi:transcriptional regulator with XRE-family HTH domain